MVVAGGSLIIVGLFVVFSGIIGMFRFPNFYTKIHGAGMIDACGIPLCLVGLACLQEDKSSSIKLLLASVFILLLSPVATHALARASLSKSIDDDEIKTRKNTSNA